MKHSVYLTTMKYQNWRYIVSLDSNGARYKSTWKKKENGCAFPPTSAMRLLGVGSLVHLVLQSGAIKQLQKKRREGTWWNIHPHVQFFIPSVTCRPEWSLSVSLPSWFIHQLHCTLSHIVFISTPTFPPQSSLKSLFFVFIWFSALPLRFLCANKNWWIKT